MSKVKATVQFEKYKLDCESKSILIRSENIVGVEMNNLVMLYSANPKKRMMHRNQSPAGKK